MSAWSEFWKVLVVFGMACFALLSVFITFGGFRDVLAMFRRMDQQHEKSGRDSAPERPKNDRGPV